MVSMAEYIASEMVCYRLQIAHHIFQVIGITNHSEKIKMIVAVIPTVKS